MKNSSKRTNSNDDADKDDKIDKNKNHKEQNLNHILRKQKLHTFNQKQPQKQK